MAIPARPDLPSPAKVGGVQSPSPPSESQPLIPGLPDEIAEQCLLHLPFPSSAVARSVSSSWKRAVSDPSFLAARRSIGLHLPYLFVLSFHRASPSSSPICFHAFDPRFHRWLPLPSLPLGPDPPPLAPSAFAVAALPADGELFVLGGMRSDSNAPLRSLLSYRAATNSWSVAAPMPTARSYFAAGAIAGKLVAAGGTTAASPATSPISTVEQYDRETDKWTPAKEMWRGGLSRYDAAVVGDKLYITEGWTWPFSYSPRGGVYDAGRDRWEEMSVGMREGWTGASVVMEDGTLFVVTECGDCKMKVYDEQRDRWQHVIGLGVPPELQKPFAVCGVAGKVYVVAAGMSVAVGTLIRLVGDCARRWKVEWEVIGAPPEMAELNPSGAHVLYA